MTQDRFRLAYAGVEVNSNCMDLLWHEFAEMELRIVDINKQ